MFFFTVYAFLQNEGIPREIEGSDPISLLNPLFSFQFAVWTVGDIFKSFP